MREYLLGLATLPTAVLGGWLGYRVVKVLSEWGTRKLRGLPLGPATSRAAFAAACACSRRVYTAGFSGVSLVLTVGFSTENYDAIRKAVYGVLNPMPAPASPRWQRTPIEPDLDFSEDGDDQVITNSETHPSGGGR